MCDEHISNSFVSTLMTNRRVIVARFKQKEVDLKNTQLLLFGIDSLQ